MNIPAGRSSLSSLLSRRDLLRVGSLGVAGTMLDGLSASSAAPTATAKSVIVLWMAGGVTHHESFDPKPDAPKEVRGSRGSIQTTLPGIRFGEVMTQLAGMADKLALVRTFATGNNDHLMSQAYGLSGRNVPPSQITTEPNVGAIVGKLLGPRNNLPGYIAVPGTTRPGPPPYNMLIGGWLGAAYGPFCSGGKPKNDDFTAQVKEASEDEFNQQALQMPVGLDGGRLNHRQTLQQRLEAGLRELDGTGIGESLHQQYRGAFDMLLSPTVRRAFDLGAEPNGVRERYGRTKIGQRCLLARRLVEAGARFVLVDYGYDPEYGNLWDNHNAVGQNHPPICDIVKLPWHLSGTDRAFAALLSDLATRGRLDETLVLFLTDFGRTPKINKEGGRDHWGNTGSIFFAGGGVKPGQVIGATDKDGGQPRGPHYSPADVAATVYRAVGINPDTVLYDRQRRPLAVLSEGRPIPGVLGG